MRKRDAYDELHLDGHTKQKHTVNFGLLENLHFTDEHILHWEDWAAGLLNVLRDAVWNPIERGAFKFIFYTVDYS